jgi:hypothetical protein
MEIFFYLIRTMFAIFVFGFNISKIENKTIRTVCLVLGGTLFSGVFVWVLAMA